MLPMLPRLVLPAAMNAYYVTMSVLQCKYVLDAPCRVVCEPLMVITMVTVPLVT